MANSSNNIICSVIILNYFGENVISYTVDSVLKSTLPSENYEIIIVDNGSTDKSHSIIENYSQKYPNIKAIFLNKNLGFSAGNNQGIKIAKGKYIFLLNNDCLVDKKCLENLIHIAESDDKIFSVGAKILLYPRYISLPNIVDPFNFINSVELIKSHLLNYYHQTTLKLSTPFELETDLDIPYDENYDKKITLKLNFANPLNQYNINRLKKNPHIKSVETLEKTAILEIDLTNPLTTNHSFKKIQNAGSLVFQDGYGRDIGAKVRFMRQDYESDIGQYNHTQSVYSFCGAAVLLNKSILNKIGFLDESFFMYYEDVEISERANLMGYKNLYSSQGTVNHLHALSSQEWSPFFIYQTEKGRLLHLLYNFPLRCFIIEFSKFLLISAGRILKTFSFSKNSVASFKVSLWFCINLPILLVKREIKILKYQPQALTKKYEQLLSGYWLTY